MAIYQTVGFFEMQGYGWSEVWYRDTQNTNLEAVRDDTFPLWQKRAAMLGAQARIKAFRVSFVDTKNDSVLQYTNLPGNAAFNAAAPDLTVYTLFRNLLNVKRKPVYVRGFDDAVSMNGGVFQPGAAAWIATADAWRTFVIQQAYGWYTRSIVAPGGFNVLSYIALGNKRVEFTCTANTFPLAQVNTYQVVTIRKLGAAGKSVLNRTWTVYVTAQDTCETTQPVSAFPHNGEVGTIKRYTWDFIPATTSSYQKVGRRAAGKVSLVTPGRQRATPLG